MGQNKGLAWKIRDDWCSP